ncbi:hypothetical protein J5N97_012908 [Dioscorea zingiberensis]|uniref:Cell wall hydroxyproline-rich glycoprotein n=1 Tax=Dioscorea zingiberensis TaxID=325984 RepID=A0A9D5HI85_9LILI|nr:hypothetical protein J5N97_012908 [Dioscorea zingiberensis]
MNKNKLSLLLLNLAFLHLSTPKISAYIGISGGVGVGVWINGQGGTTSTPSSTPSSTPTPSSPSNKEYTALQTWKSAITEDPNGVLSTWVGPNPCSYKGVFCSDLPGGLSTITGIDLNHAHLKGTLVSALSLLTNLNILHLNTNSFTGTVPDTFSNLHSLTELDLSNNLLSGPFPAPTLYIPSLIYLDLRFNSFSGQIPEELFEKQLDAIFLNNNQFEGEIPMNLWTSPASVITLANNKLSGAIPASFGYSGLKEVLFLNNKLTGCIPEGVGYLQDIEVLDLSFNSITGHLPNSLSCLTGMEVLNLGHNQLSGVLPDLCDLKSLANLTVAFNFLSGLSEDCGRGMLRAVGFDLSGNCIPGRDMQRPPLDCLGVPGGDLSCLRIPSTGSVDCPGVTVHIGAGVLPGVSFSLPSSLP